MPSSDLGYACGMIRLRIPGFKTHAPTTEMPLFLALAVLAPIYSSGAEPLQAISGAQLVAWDFNDADSFRVRLPRKGEQVIRLYYVDAPETTYGAVSGRRRVLEQSRYFGLEKPLQIIDFGRAATAFVKRTLKKPFIVHTAFARAQGRSGKPRIYAMVETSDGQDLAKLLVENGLARAQGIGRAMPKGTPASEYAAFLDDLETAAGLKRAGIWKATNSDRIAELRRQQREETRELNEALRFGVFATVSKDNPLDLNTATAEELQQLKGIGPVLAERITEGQPYKQVEDLVDVHGIGRAILERIKPLLTIQGKQDGKPSDELN